MAEPLAAVPVTGSCSGAVSVSAQGVETGEQLSTGGGKGASSGGRGEEWITTGGKKKGKLSVYVFHSKHGIFRRKSEYQNTRAKI